MSFLPTKFIFRHLMVHLITPSNTPHQGEVGVIKKCLEITYPVILGDEQQLIIRGIMCISGNDRWYITSINIISKDLTNSKLLFFYLHEKPHTFQ